jgi:mono/diheme cytochrome c family protein
VKSIKKVRIIGWLAVPVAIGVATASAADFPHPVIPGLHQKHPLNERQVGEVLINELRCASCHEGMSSADMKAAPDLRQVGARLNRDYIRRFIADPAALQPGTTMPNMMTSGSEEDRAAMSESITHYLLSLQEPASAPPDPSLEGNAKAGRELYHRVGCVACHSPRDDAGNESPAAGELSLAHVQDKYNPYALADFLLNPLKTRPSGRMPDMNLTKDEAVSIATYLTPDASAPSVEPPRPTASEVAAGKAAFKSLNCASCHQMDDPELKPVSPGPPRGMLDLQRGCLSDQPTGAPDFHLSAGQVKSIRAALAAPGANSTPSEQIKLRLTQLNCIACHVRDDYGGVAADRDAFFHSSEEALGNEARIPPPLTLAGAKLRPEWLNRVLYDGERVRPYMDTRMPQYGEQALKGLSEWLTETDRVQAGQSRLLDVDEMPVMDRAENIKMRNGAHQLLGDTGLSCIACHNFNGIESPGMKGLDLMTSYQRLQPAWFQSFMKNPEAHRPGIIMPNYWPDGKAVQTGVLDGDTDLQLQALWHMFSLGRSAPMPSGLRSPEIKLEVTDKTLVYRGRSRIAGYRGIAVGFPGGMNYAFNAQNGSLSGLWQGEFVNVNWKSQGAGDFTPVGKAISLAQDVAFFNLDDDKAAWPLMPPVPNKENPINSDPLYPRNHGYAFLGYALDETAIPTFTYRCGDVTIEDRSAPLTGEGARILRRNLGFSTTTPATLYLRALTGEITAESERVFRTPELRLRLTKGRAFLRPASSGEGEQELLIQLSIPEGSSNCMIDYELLD